MPFERSLRKAISQRHNSIVYAEMDNRGVRRGDTGQILAQLRRPVASRVAPYWVMRLAPYRLIRMAIEMACDAGAYFSFVDFMSCITIAKLVHYKKAKL